MSRDIRVSDNWALLHAVDEAQRTNSPLATVFTLVTIWCLVHSWMIRFCRSTIFWTEAHDRRALCCEGCS